MTEMHMGIVVARIDALHNDMTDMRDSMRESVKEMSRL